MTDTPITVIIPCFNAAPWLRGSIESALSQTRRPAEVIVVDDVSTDGSYEIAGEYPVRQFRSHVNSGPAFVRNIALRECRSPLVAWLDADDLWDRRHCEVVAGLLERHPAASVAFSGVRLIGTRSGEWRMPIPCSGPSSLLWESYKNTTVPAMSALTRLETCNSIGGFRQDIRVAPDYDFWVRIALRHKFVWTQEITASYRWHKDQISSNLTLQHQSVLQSRVRLYREACQQESPEICREMKRQLVELWESELSQAWWDADVPKVRGMLHVGLCPEVDTKVTRRIATLAKIHPRAVKAWRELQRYAWRVRHSLSRPDRLR